MNPEFLKLQQIITEQLKQQYERSVYEALYFPVGGNNSSENDYIEDYVEDYFE